MVRREDDPDFINRIANDASVRPFIREDGAEMDFTPLTALRPGESGCIILSNGEDAVGIFEQTTDKVFQVHTMFGPTCRGRRAIDTAKEMVAWMFARNVDVVWGATPRDNRKARWFNRQVGAVTLPTSDEETEIFELRRAC